MTLLALLTLLAAPAHAEPSGALPEESAEPPTSGPAEEPGPKHEVDVEFDGAIHGQVFYAPGAPGQQAHALGGPLIGAEVELRVDQLGFRAYAAVWPLPVLATLGTAIYKHQPLGPGTWYWGGDVGVAYAFGTPRVVAGPSLGVRRRFDVGQVSSVVGLRATVGIGVDLADSNDWVFLESGRSVGVHGSIVLTMHGPTL